MTPSSSPTPLIIDITEPAEKQIAGAGEYLRERVGDDAAIRFVMCVGEEFIRASETIAQDIASSESGKPVQLPDEIASIRWSQPIYRLSIETAVKRRRGSSAGLWYAYYALRSGGGSGPPDTMVVFAFRHSAARPLSISD